MANLGMGTRKSTVERSDERNHDIVDQVLSNAAVREAHALGETSLVHFPFPVIGANFMESFVQEQVDGNFDEASGSEEVAQVEDPSKIMRVGAALCDPKVEG